MTPDPLVEAIRSAPCRRLVLTHPECTAAAVREWVAGVLADVQHEHTWGLEAATALDEVRARLVGAPYDLDVEPEGEQ